MVIYYITICNCEIWNSASGFPTKFILCVVFNSKETRRWFRKIFFPSIPPCSLPPFFWLYYLVLHMYKQPKCCVRNEEIHPPIPHQSEPCPEKTRQSLTFNVVDQDRVIMKRIYCFLAEPYAQTGTTVSAETVSSSVL